MKVMCKLLSVITLLLMCSSWVYAHQLAPMLFTITEKQDGLYALQWKESELKPKGVEVAPVMPAFCQKVTQPEISYSEKAYYYQWNIVCEESLRGNIIAFEGLEAARNNVMVVFTDLENQQLTQLVNSRHPEYRLPEAETLASQLKRHTLSGIEHLVFGWDHVLFVLGLFGILASSRRTLIWAITAFTAGHSITLLLASLGYIPFNAQWVEILIALSIFMLAVELFMPEDWSGKFSLRRQAYVLTFLFGLVHGCGFANVLSEALSGSKPLLMPLLAFNVGIELGQLMVIVLAMISGYLLVKAKLSYDQMRKGLGYVLGTMSSYWVLVRVLG